jgi:tetratricopeptide (TPR) repeat protein
VDFSRVRFRCAATVLVLLAVPLVASTAPPQAQTTRKPSPSQKSAQTPSRAAQPSPYEELQTRLQEQRAAIASGDAVAVEKTSPALVAFALRGMAQIRSLESAWPQAVEIYRQSLALEDDTATRLELATACISADKFDDGLNEVNKALTADPKNARAWHVKAKLFMAKDDYHGAVNAATRSLELRRDADVQLLLALAYLNLKEKPKAEAVFRQMLQDYGDRAIWHFVFGGAYGEAGYQDEAISEFRKALALDPNLAHVHYFLGMALLERNNNETSPEILQEFQAEVRQLPDDFFGNYTLGGIESRGGGSDLEQSNKHLLAAAKADPNNPDPYLYLRLNAYKQKDNAAAEAYLRKAIALTGDDVSRNGYHIRRGYIALARILASEGKKEEAQAYFDKAKTLSDQSRQSSSDTMADATGNQDAAPGVLTSRPAPKPKVAFCRVNQTRNLLLAEHLRKVTNLLRIWRLGDAPAAPQHVNIEEAQRSQPQDHSVGAELQLGEEHRLILANVLRAKLVGWTMKISAEVLNPMKV